MPNTSTSGQADARKSLPIAFAGMLRILQRGARFVFENFYSFLVKLPWVVAVVIIAAILIRGLTQYVTVIEPISVPKTLMESGYAPEVAAKRLRDAMANFAATVNTRMRSPEIALHGELPNIIVPTVGISLDAIVSSIRTLLRSTRSRTVAGEFIIIGNQLWLRLRMDGREIYSSKEGGHPDKPDELLRIAAPEALKIIQPYFAAVSLSESDPASALEMVESIIARLPEWDENVAWSYNLRSSILRQRKDYDAAAQAARKALQINGQLAVAHVNLGNVFQDQGDHKKAIAEYQLAIKLDPKYAGPHNNLGNSLRASGKNDEAIAEYREAIKLDPKDAMSRNNLGIALRASGKNEEAIAEYRKAIKLDPKYKFAHNNLGNILRAIGKSDEAIAEYREAIKLDPKYTNARNNLALALSAIGKNEEAIAEYRAVLSIDSDNATARKGLDDLSIKSVRRDKVRG